MKREETPMLDYILTNEQLQEAITVTDQLIKGAEPFGDRKKKLEEHFEFLLENQKYRVGAVVDGEEE